MILQEDQIISAIENPLLGDEITKAQKLSTDLNIHINGIGVDSYLKQLENFESSEQFQERLDVTISQKHIFHSIVRIINKIFTAKGGSNYYDIKGKSKKSEKDVELELIDKLKDIKGIPLRKWIQNKGLNKYLVDPNGVFLIEHKKVGNKGISYPTYKSIGSIHDYQYNGRKLEYVLFQLEPITIQDEQVEQYRLYDDEKDLYFYVRNQEVVEIKQFKNPWGEVPGIVIGDFYHNEFDIFDSRFSIGTELAAKRLRTESVKNAYEHKHGFPITWQLLFKKCLTCNGEGFIKGKVCPDCGATGYDLNKDVSKVLGIVPPETRDDPSITEVGGYIQPDIETWREQRTELDWLEKKLQYTLLGSYIQDKRDRETATSRFIDVQPVNDTLNDFADWVENTEKFITNIMAKYYYKSGYGGCSINLGRRYMIEGPDELWEKYEKARKAGAPTEKLDDDIFEYYEAKYANDAKTLQVQKKLFMVNDYRHLTIQEAKENLPWDEYLKRVLFDSWKLTVKSDYIAKTEIKKLKTDFDTYINERKKTLKNDETGNL